MGKVVGIDLGTTNCAVAAVPVDGGAVETFEIPQVVGPGEIGERATLPSFLLLPSEHEVPSSQLELPWTGKMRYAVGTFARDRGADLPHRLVSSAKDWITTLIVRPTDRSVATDQHERPPMSLACGPGPR